MTPADRAFRLVSGYRASQMVYAAAELDLPDLIAAGQATVEELSASTHVEASRLRRLLRGLVALEVLEEHGDRYSNTEVGEMFRRDVPASRRAGVRMLIPESYRSWSRFMETLRTGVPGQLLEHNETMWQRIAREPEFAIRFNEAMAINSKAVVDFVAKNGEFDSASVLADIGGGKGALIAGVLVEHPKLHGIVFDIPGGLGETAAHLAERGVADRCEIVQGSFFESVPPADVYLLKDILHDWDDEHATQILGVCRRAINPGGRLMIVERVAPSHMTSDPGHFASAMTDLHMMVQLGGRERTLEDFDSLFAATGFEATRFTPGEVFHLLEASAVDRTTFSGMSGVSANSGGRNPG
ncbi:MAG TPA: methyltransferase [Candidatus Dormibacteraeota bacterium]|nr:methyltransferase [Candidatus Dormibacteraeota bacterium]